MIEFSNPAKTQVPIIKSFLPLCHLAILVQATPAAGTLDPTAYHLLVVPVALLIVQSESFLHLKQKNRRCDSVK